MSLHRRILIGLATLGLLWFLSVMILAEDTSPANTVAPDTSIQTADGQDSGEETQPVAAQDGGVNGENDTVKETSPEPPVIGLLPPETYGASVTLSWSVREGGKEGSGGIYKYFVQQSTEPDFSKNMVVTEAGDTTSYTFDGLSYNTVYYFRVYAGDKEGNPLNLEAWDQDQNPGGVRWSAITRTRCMDLPVNPTGKQPEITGITPAGFDPGEKIYFSPEKNPAVAWSFTQTETTGLFTGIASGSGYSVALGGDGSVWAWGGNSYGQLGDGTTASPNNPVHVKGANGKGFLTEIIMVSARTYHTLALKRDGTVWAWGRNDYGQLGDGTTVNKNTPSQVKGPGGIGFLTNIIAVAAGNNHSLALKDDGTVWAWGNNIDGRLGDGSKANKNSPVPVKGAVDSGFLAGIKALAAGYRHSVALKSDGTVWAWGYNAEGELGNGAVADQNLPVQVKGVNGNGYLTGITAVTAGKSQTAALTDEGVIWTWGGNEFGQLGDGTKANKTTPVRVQVNSGIDFQYAMALAAGANHLIILKKDGTVWTLGENTSGQRGNTSTTNLGFPIQVAGVGGVGLLTGITVIAGGNNHTLALNQAGLVLSWGTNDQGQLGDCTTTNRSLPIFPAFIPADQLRIVEYTVQPRAFTEYPALKIDPARNSTKTNWNLPDGQYVVYLGKVNSGILRWSDGASLVVDTAPPVVAVRKEEAPENGFNLYLTSNEPVKYELYWGDTPEDLKAQPGSSDYLLYDGTQPINLSGLDISPGNRYYYRLAVTDRTQNTTSTPVETVGEDEADNSTDVPVETGDEGNGDEEQGESQE
jgi:alpha-tubulin suppressor-like RCC1 family protein